MLLRKLNAMGRAADTVLLFEARGKTNHTVGLRAISLVSSIVEPTPSHAVPHHTFRPNYHGMYQVREGIVLIQSRCIPCAYPT